MHFRLLKRKEKPQARARRPAPDFPQSQPQPKKSAPEGDDPNTPSPALTTAQPTPDTSTEGQDPLSNGYANSDSLPLDRPLTRLPYARPGPAGNPERERLARQFEWRPILWGPSEKQDKMVPEGRRRSIGEKLMAWTRKSFSRARLPSWSSSDRSERFHGEGIRSQFPSPDRVDTPDRVRTPDDDEIRGRVRTPIEGIAPNEIFDPITRTITRVVELPSSH